MTIELAFNILMSIAVTVFGLWVKTLTAKIDDTAEKISRVMIDYQTRADARAENNDIGGALRRLEDKIDRLTEKIDKKADKS